MGSLGWSYHSPVRHRPIAVSCFEGLARVASEQADYARAARLLGAADALETSLGRRQQAGHADRRRFVAKLQTALGPGALQGALDEGRAMALEPAIDYALSAGLVAVEPRTAPGGLTVRELQVAALVAHGMSNRAIATELVVAERTAETHVQNILNKLGFSSRAQVAAWAMEQGLRQPKSHRP